jgi:hypothetical protein
MGACCSNSDGAMKDSPHGDTTEPLLPHQPVVHTVDNAPLPHRLGNRPPSNEEDGDGEQKQQSENKTNNLRQCASNEYKSFSVAIPVPQSKVDYEKEKVTEVEGVAIGGSLSNSNFPFSLPLSTTAASDSFEEGDLGNVHRRQRSTTHMSYFEPECIICLEHFTLSNPRISSKCRCKGITANPMHLGCLLNWTEQQQEQICPVCRDHIHFEGSD